MIDAVDEHPPGRGGATHPRDAGGRTYRSGLVAVLVLATLIRVGYSLVIAGDYPAGDGQRYSLVGATIADGRGFADPFSGGPAGDHPPLTFLVEAISPALVRTDAEFRGLPLWLFGQRLTMVVVGVGTVATIAALTRRLAGDRAALTAGLLAAVNPNLWVNDGLLMAEALAALVTGLFLVAVYRAVDSSTIGRWALTGAVGGLAALVRSEALLAVVLTVVPLVVWAHRRDLGDALARLGALAASAALVCSTWVVPNMIRFPEPVAFSTNDGLTLLGAYCPDTFNGELTGLWSLRCVRLADADDNGVDDWTDFQTASPTESPPPEPSAQSIAFRRVAIDYATANMARLPTVMSVRVLRMWGAYRPEQMVSYNEGEARRRSVSWAAWGWHVATAPLVVFGLVRLRRSRISIWPLVAQGVAATAVAALVYGLVRFRVGWDVAATVAMGVGLVSARARWSESPSPEPEPTS